MRDGRTWRSASQRVSRVRGGDGCEEGKLCFAEDEMVSTIRAQLAREKCARRAMACAVDELTLQQLTMRHTFLHGHVYRNYATGREAGRIE